MRNIPPLDALLPKTRQGILAATLLPEKAWYASELARRMGVPSSSLQRELRDLSKAGILKAHRQGRIITRPTSIRRCFPICAAYCRKRPAWSMCRPTP